MAVIIYFQDILNKEDFIKQSQVIQGIFCKSGRKAVFTGLIEEMGIVREIITGVQSRILKVSTQKIAGEVSTGDSVAVNGVCLTVTRHEKDSFEADVMAETLKKSNLGNLKLGDRVNLEAALRAGDRLGGHFVSGHVDGVGVIRKKYFQDVASVMEIEAPSEVMQVTVPQGSIAVDGVSLTVVKCLERSFFVSLVPHTQVSTILGYKKIGDEVNLEADLIGRHIAYFMRKFKKAQQQESLTRELLSANGFFEGLFGK